MVLLLYALLTSGLSKLALDSCVPYASNRQRLNTKLRLDQSCRVAGSAGMLGEIVTALFNPTTIFRGRHLIRDPTFCNLYF